MILTSKIFFRALLVHPDPEIRIYGSRDLFFWIFRSRSIHTALEKNLLAKTIYGPHLLFLTNFDLALPSRGHSTDQSQFYQILLRDPLVGWVVQKNFSNKSCCPYMILVSKIFLVAIGCLWDAQEAPDLPLAVAPTGIDLAWSD